MSNIGIEVDQSSLRQLLINALPKAQKANINALVKVGKLAKTKTVRETAGNLSTRQKDIRKRFGVYRPKKKTSKRGASVRFVFSSRYRVASNDAALVSSQFPSAFRATMPSGKTGFFARRPNAFKTSPKSSATNPSWSGRANPKRSSLPIDQAKILLHFGLAATAKLKRSMISAARAKMNERYDDFFWSEYSREVEKRSQQNKSRR